MQLGLGLNLCAALGATWMLQSGGVKATLDLDFVRGLAWNNNGGVSIASLLACTRATPAAAYYTKADSTLTTFAANTLRYGTNGLLVEEARTNLCLQSQTFDNATWTKTLCTVGANAIAGPDGTTTADALIPNNGSVSCFFEQTPIAVSNATNYTFSLFAKNGALGSDWFELVIVAGGAAWRAWFNLSTGLKGSQQGSPVSYTITALANGWYRCDITVLTVSNTAFDVYIAPRPADNNTGALTGDGATPALYAWGADVEPGTFASSYIPTTTASVTRAVDVVTFSDLTWFDGASESFYVEWTGKGVANANLFVLDAADDVTLNEQAGISPKLADASATYAITTGNTGAAGAILKAAGRLKTNDIALCLNGGTVGTDTSATQPGTLAAARLGVDLAGANSLNSYIRRFAAWKTLQLSNAALQALTA